ncbi:MAG: PIN domain-containing protein, partial [Patescibacteria group bacterium]|nr:PIN domain-containing protein [Patescibacteria group bacterium]
SLMKRYFIDTNVFIDIVIKRDEKRFDECNRLFKKIKANKIKAATGNVVLAELIWTLSSFYKAEKSEIARRIKAIIQLRGIIFVDDYDSLKAIDLFQTKSIKFIDALIASIKPIQEKKWIVVSFDRDFDKLGVIRKEPGQL